MKAGGKVERLAPNVVKNSTKCGYKKVNWQLKNGGCEGGEFLFQVTTESNPTKLLLSCFELS